MYVSQCILILLSAYLIGSVPFGILLAKAFGLPDPRSIGSGNIGATNMLRTGRKDIALLTLLLDAGKGAAAVLVAMYFSYSTVAGALALFGAILGHCSSPWLKFRGGKGVATMMGGILAFYWPLGMLVCLVWLLSWRITRYVSVASLAAALAIPLFALFWICGAAAMILAVASGIVVYRHGANIARLRASTEPKLGGRHAA
jgi:glycerol-3-phosphate acyltransferase PlsY